MASFLNTLKTDIADEVQEKKEVEKEKNIKPFGNMYLHLNMYITPLFPNHLIFYPLNPNPLNPYPINPYPRIL